MSDNPAFDIFEILSKYKSVSRSLAILHANITNLVADEEEKITSPTDFAYRRFCGKQREVSISQAMNRRLNLEIKVVKSIEKSKKK